MFLNSEFATRFYFDGDTNRKRTVIKKIITDNCLTEVSGVVEAQLSL